MRNGSGAGCLVLAFVIALAIYALDRYVVPGLVETMLANVKVLLASL